IDWVGIRAKHRPLSVWASREPAQPVRVWHPRCMTASGRGSRPLPPVEQVGPGLWSIPVPLPIPLRYVFVYAFATDRGPFLVDAGWNTDEAFTALDAGLAQAGFAMTDVQGVMVTHIHPDH